MSGLTAEETQNIIDNFYPGCTVVWGSDVIATCAERRSGELRFSFSTPDFVSSWNCKIYLQSHRHRISNPKHPDGREFTLESYTKDKTGHTQLSRNLAKSRLLEARAKVPTRVKHKVQPLPFPKGAI